VVARPTGPPHPPAGGPGAGAAVSFARSGLTVNWDDACETGLLSGAVAYSPEPIDQPAEGNALICCSQAQGELVLDL
jgi:hypothetical protein